MYVVIRVTENLERVENVPRNIHFRDFLYAVLFILEEMAGNNIRYVLQ